jgi:hypothetical protein
MPSFALLAAGFGVGFGLSVALLTILDCYYVLTGHPTISRRAVQVTQTRIVPAVVVSALLGLLVGMLVGHLFLGQVVAIADPPPAQAAASWLPSCEVLGDACACSGACGIAVAQQPAPEASRTLLAFSTKFCPGCVRMKRELEKRPELVKQIEAAYTVRRYDAGKDADTAQKWGVTEVPCCVIVDGEGREVKRFVGYKSCNDLAAWLGL